MSDPWYVTLFSNYAKTYDNESFTQGTLGECDFLERELNYNKSLHILDVGCGTGRHSIELTKRGYTITGIDFSDAQLQRAKDKATLEHLDIPFIQADARELPFKGEFDAAIMLCEGGFPLMETDRENAQILQSVSRALKDEALFIFTTLNGLFPLCNSLNDFYDANKDTGATCDSSHFDVLTMRDRNITQFTDDDHIEHTIHSNERYYLPSEITWLLGDLGFSTVELFGAHLGAFNRDHPLTKDDFEMLVVAQKNITAQNLIDAYTSQIQRNTLNRAYRLIIDTLQSLGKALQAGFPEAKVTSLYQGYVDMSYVALSTPRLTQHDLKLAVVYVHESGCFEGWLVARNRNLQDTYREKFRGTLHTPYQLVEKGPGVDAIVMTVLENKPDFADANLVDHLVTQVGKVLHDLERLLS
jgi:ubiquinone/menaquinone biosynthesis C-methylase UbiE